MLFPFTVTNPQKSHSHDIAYTETTQGHSVNRIKLAN